MPLLYRSMPEADDGYPATGEWGLGVRVDWDVFVDDDMVVPGGGGLSVFADPSHMPSFRLPPEFGGDGRHPMWTIDTEELEGFADLELVPGDALGQATG